MLIQVMKLSAKTIPMPSQKGVKSKCAITYKCNIHVVGVLLELFGGLQIFKLKHVMDDHDLTKVYSLFIYFTWGHLTSMHTLLAIR